MGITNLLLGDSPDVNAASDALVASLDLKRDLLVAQIQKITANTFLDPNKLNDVLTDFLQDINGGLPSDKA